jgi:hypothetical protein
LFLRPKIVIKPRPGQGLREGDRDMVSRDFTDAPIALRTAVSEDAAATYRDLATQARGMN